MSSNVQNSPLMSNSSQEELSHMAFLDEFASIFTNSILIELPPSCGDGDHKIDLVPKNVGKTKFLTFLFTHSFSAKKDDS